MSAKISPNVTSTDAGISSEQHKDLPTVCDRHQNSTSDFWDTEKELQYSHGDSHNYSAQAADLSFEEEMLNSAFLECDSEGNGKVSVIQIIDYLKSVTDASRDGNRLVALRKMFDPDDKDILVDLQTFRTVMTQWIAGCCQDRNLKMPLDDVFIKDPEQPFENKYSTEQLERYSGHVQNFTGEQADLIGKVADLMFINKKLTDQKIRLQKNLELAEETNACLTEEIAEIKSKLKSSQQAMQQSLSIHSELEDIKTFTKDLEEKISVLCVQKKKLEKQNLQLSSQKQHLQEESDKLLMEKERAKGKLDDICSENTKLVLQVCEYERLLLQKENCLAQKNLQSAELQTLIEEYKFLLELKTEKNASDQLSQIHEDINISTHPYENQCSGNQPQQSVCKELQEAIELVMPYPLCGISEDTSLLNINLKTEDICAEIELMLDHLKQLAHGFQDVPFFRPSVSQLKEQSSILVQSLRCLMQIKCAWETYASKLNGAPQINTQEELSPSERTRLEKYVTAEDMQLVPYQRPNKCRHRDSLTEGSLYWFLPNACQFMLWLRKHCGCSISIPRILLLALLCNFLLLPTRSREHIGTTTAAFLWPHLRIQYLDMPPF
ncbi:protein KASH5 isoform X2 [Pyxicephalus adspersus]|uniref:protein KASH5 isoform X2 n=1 Tax=Pyxicephalus adspersus TaxID=30357 RepID=UPI003B598E45